MADIRTLYTVDVRGDFEQRLRALSESTKAAKEDWKSLRLTFIQNGASLRKTKEELRALGKAEDEAAVAANKRLTANARLLSGERALAKAYNGLVNEQNKLTISRLRSLQALEQEASATPPRIVQARAEARALSRIEAELVRLEEARILQTEAARKGLQVSADGTRFFDAEAEAMRRAGKAAEELAVKKILASRGLDTVSKAPIQGPTQVKGLTLEDERLAQEKAYENFRKKAFSDRVKDIQKEKGIISSKADEIKRASKTATESQPPFSRLLFTFRRLVGVMAAFTIARKVVAGFTGIISEAIRFNAAIEATRVGMAGLIAASAEIRTLDGQRLTTADQIKISSNIAISQMEKLRTAALQTAASYEEVASAFSQAVSPGLRAGLNLDQIRQVTVSISQAATGLGVAQDQLSEEIRSLFQGTINPRNTRIATALGISSADIRRAKELGSLFTFLQNRFSAISATGKVLMDTFTGQLSNAQDALSQILAQTSKPLFEQLKQGLKEVQSAIFSTINDQTVFKPEALRAFSGLFEGLANGIRGIRTAFGSIDIRGFADSFGFIGEALGTAATLLANAFSAFFNVAAPAITFLKTVFRAVTSIVIAASKVDEALGGWIATLVQTVAKVSLLLLTARKVYSLFLGLKNALLIIPRLITAAHRATLLLATATSNTAKAVVFLRVNFQKIVVPIVAIAAILTLIVKLIPGAGKAFDAVAEKLGSLFGVLDRVLNKVLGLDTALEEIDSAGTGLVVDDFRDLSSTLDEVSQKIVDIKEEASRQREVRLKIAGVSPDVASQIREFYDGMNASEVELRQALREREQALSRIARISKDTKSFEDQKGSLQLEKEISDTVFDLQKKKASMEREMLSLQQKATQFSREGRPLPTTEMLDLENKMRDLDGLIKGAKKDLFEQRQAIEDNKKAFLEGLAEQNSLYENIAAIDRKIFEARKASAEAAALLVLTSAEEYAIRLKISAVKTLADTQSEIQVSRARISGTQEEIALAEALAQKRRAAVDLFENEAIFQRDKISLLEQINKLEQYGGEQGKKAADQVRLQLSSLEAIHLLDAARLESARKLAAEEERIAKIRKEGSFGDGFSLGLEEWKKQVGTLATFGEEFAKNLNDGLASVAGQSFRGALASALDPNSSFDIQAAITNLGLDLAASVVENLARQLLSSLISIPVDTAGAVASGAILTSAGVNVSVSMTTGAAAAALMLNTAALNLMLAMQGQQAGTLFKGIATASSIVGSVGVGYASGGAVGMRRPSRGIDPRDTVPAFLRPGEWVIRPEAVQHYGHSIMSLLNRKRLDPNLVRALAASPRSIQEKSPSNRSFATGGPVGPSAARGSSTSKPVVVAQFFDEQVMDRAFAAGPEATLQFVRRRRRAYRGALSMED